jgi:hypothetical protein
MQDLGSLSSRALGDPTVFPVESTSNGRTYWLNVDIADSVSEDPDHTAFIERFQPYRGKSDRPDSYLSIPRDWFSEGTFLNSGKVKTDLRRVVG